MLEMGWFLKAYGRAQDVLYVLDVGAQTPTDLSRKLNLHATNIRRELRRLESKQLVECLTPKKNKGRLYFSTPKGREVLRRILQTELQTLDRASRRTAIRQSNKDYKALKVKILARKRDSYKISK